MQIQSNLFAPSAATTSGVSSSNVKRSQVEPTHQVEQSQQSQGLDEVSQQVNYGQTDGDNSQQHAQLAPLNPAPEELESRLGAKLEYEQQTQSSDGAVAQYLSNQHAAQREAIQLMVGIDTYA